MSKTVQFVKNFDDLSTENGFQWEFKCDSCGRGFRTRFDQFNFGTISTIAETVGEFLGGVVDKVASLGENVRDTAWEREHDKAFVAVVKQLKKNDFMLCPGCGEWVCRANCWDKDDKKCKSCSVTEDGVEDIDESPDEQDGAKDGDDVIICSNCAAEFEPTDKFCSECGAELEVAEFCTNCGSELDPGDKFCPECGHAV